MKQDSVLLRQQLRKIRLARNLRQKDMLFRIGMSQQQYQSIESGKDIRLSTLFRILEGLDTSMVLVPNEKMDEIDQILHPGETMNASTLLDTMKDLED